MPVSPLVTLDVWGVPGRRIPDALTRMALDRAPLRQQPGLTFAKLLGTGSGRTFTVADADLHHWALLTVWAASADRRRFDSTRTVAGWHCRSNEHCRVDLEPVSSRGRWAGREPFGDPRPRREAAGEPVAALTRARLVPHRAVTFWRAVPPVSTALRQAPGLHFALGIGEAPIGLQGTFSIWRDAEAVRDFAYRNAAHGRAIADTSRIGWYAEELFARFRVLSVAGLYDGRRLLG